MPAADTTVTVPPPTLTVDTDVLKAPFLNTLSAMWTRLNTEVSTVRMLPTLLVTFVVIEYISAFQEFSTATSPIVWVTTLREWSINSNSKSVPSEARRYLPS